MLLQKLELTGDKCLDKCNEYAVDDPLIELARRDLEEKIRILEDATKILYEV